MDKIASALFVLFTCMSVTVIGEVTYEQNMKDAETQVEVTYEQNMKDAETQVDTAKESLKPGNMMCDVCTAIAFQITMAFKRVHKQNKSREMLSYENITNITDSVCKGEQWKEYGIKTMEFQDQERLSGPGLNTHALPGTMKRDVDWSDRLKDLCQLYLETFTPSTIYTAHINRRTWLHMCRNGEVPGLSDVCSQRGRKTPKRPSEEL